jgi:hypothetical protein
MEIASRTFYLTIGAIISMVLLAIYFPFVAGFIWFLAIGTAILFTIYRSFRKGYIAVNLKYKVAIYDRRINPASFWLFAVIGIYIGILSCLSSIFFLLHKFPDFK